MVVLIGNSPSTGSTYLADLIDSVPGFMCGPESRFFCYKELYTEYKKFRDKILDPLAFATPSLQNYRGTVSLKTRVLSAYGLDKEKVKDLVAESYDARSFMNGIHDSLMRYRGLKGEQILVEKYPENIFIAEEFLNSIEDGYLIEIIRDPLRVYNSLRSNKGFPKYIAIGQWIMAMNGGRKTINHPRHLQLKYEELVQNPFDTIAKLTTKISNRTISAEEIEKEFHTNDYRAENEVRDKRWSNSQFGTNSNANLQDIDQTIIDEYNSFGGLKINDNYSNLYNLKNTSIDELCEIYGYNKPTNKSSAKIDMYAIKHMLMKYMIDGFKDQRMLNYLSSYLSPLER